MVVSVLLTCKLPYAHKNVLGKEIDYHIRNSSHDFSYLLSTTADLEVLLVGLLEFVGLSNISFSVSPLRTKVSASLGFS